MPIVWGPGMLPSCTGTIVEIRGSWWARRRAGARSAPRQVTVRREVI